MSLTRLRVDDGLGLLLNLSLWGSQSSGWRMEAPLIIRIEFPLKGSLKKGSIRATIKATIRVRYSTGALIIRMRVQGVGLRV